MSVTYLSWTRINISFIALEKETPKSINREKVNKMKF